VISANVPAAPKTEASVVKLAAKTGASESAFNLAKKASLNVEAGIINQERTKTDDQVKAKKQLEDLLPSLKASAVGVAQKAAEVAAAQAEKPYLDQYYAAVQKRVNAEKYAEKEKKLVGQMHQKLVDGSKVAVHALEAQEALAAVVTKQTLDQTATLQEKYAEMEAEKEKLELGGTTSLSEAASAGIRKKSDEEVKKYTAMVELEEENAAAAKKSLEETKAALRKAEEVRLQASALRKEREKNERVANGADAVVLEEGLSIMQEGSHLKSSCARLEVSAALGFALACLSLHVARAL